MPIASCIPDLGLASWAAQGGLALTALGVIPLMPPNSGDIPLIPVDPIEARTVAAVTIRNGGALVARGSWPGSIVIEGEHGHLLGPLLAAHAPMVTGPAVSGGGLAR